MPVLSPFRRADDPPAMPDPSTLVRGVDQPGAPPDDASVSPTTLVMNYLRTKNLQPSSANVSAALAANARDPTTIPGLTNAAPPPADAPVAARGGGGGGIPLPPTPPVGAFQGGGGTSSPNIPPNIGKLNLGATGDTKATGGGGGPDNSSLAEIAAAILGGGAGAYGLYHALRGNAADDVKASRGRGAPDTSAPPVEAERMGRAEPPPFRTTGVDQYQFNELGSPQSRGALPPGVVPPPPQGGATVPYGAPPPTIELGTPQINGLVTPPGATPPGAPRRIANDAMDSALSRATGEDILPFMRGAQGGLPGGISGPDIANLALKYGTDLNRPTQVGSSRLTLQPDVNPVIKPPPKSPRTRDVSAVSFNDLKSGLQSLIRGFAR